MSSFFFTVHRGEGDVPALTMQQGSIAADDEDSLKIGACGAVLVEDFHFREKDLSFLQTARGLTRS
jgi:catalase